MFEPREANSGCFSPSSPRPPLTPNACGPDCPQMGTGRSLEGHWSADGREGPQHAWHTLSCSPSLSFLRGVGGGLPVKPSRESWTQTLRRPWGLCTCAVRHRSRELRPLGCSFRILPPCPWLFPWHLPLLLPATFPPPGVTSSREKIFHDTHSQGLFWSLFLLGCHVCF